MEIIKSFRFWICLVIAIGLSGGCSHVVPRHCKHLLGKTPSGESLAPWNDTQCKRAQLTRNIMIGVTSALAVTAGGTGIATVFPDGETQRMATGVTSVISAALAAVVAPFIASTTSDLANHCEVSP